MKLICCSVRDSAVQAYMPPFFSRHLGEAMRSFGDLCRDPQSNVSRHPSDFHLYLLGEYDDVTGIITAAEPQRMASATEFVQSVSDGPGPS